MRKTHTFRDGSTISGEAEHVDRAIAFERDRLATEATWIEQLRADGIKAAHPDDGWVDRAENTVHLCYPQFNDGVEIGDRIALGWQDKWRVVRVTGSREATPIMRPIWPESHGPWWWEFDTDA